MFLGYSKSTNLILYFFAILHILSWKYLAISLLFSFCIMFFISLQRVFENFFLLNFYVPDLFLPRLEKIKKNKICIFMV